MESRLLQHYILGLGLHHVLSDLENIFENPRAWFSNYNCHDIIILFVMAVYPSNPNNVSFSNQAPEQLTHGFFVPLFQGNDVKAILVLGVQIFFQGIGYFMVITSLPDHKKYLQTTSTLLITCLGMGIHCIQKFVMANNTLLINWILPAKLSNLEH